jgi:hypothetical protein
MKTKMMKRTFHLNPEDESKSRALIIARMLAWAVAQHEQLSEQRLWKRVEELFPQVYARVTGGPPIAWATVRRHINGTHGAPAFPKADCEWTAEREAVVAAYNEIVGNITQDEKGQE